LFLSGVDSVKPILIMSVPLETSEIVSKIKSYYSYILKRRLKKYNSLFGNTENKPLIEICFTESTPDKNNFYVSETEEMQCYLVKDYEQVIDILKELKIDKENTEDVIRALFYNYKIKNDGSKPFYLRVGYR
jgi:hypothetical protein